MKASFHIFVTLLYVLHVGYLPRPSIRYGGKMETLTVQPGKNTL